jgi:hypothetical protein
MKHMFIKSMAVAATLMLAWNCTDDSNSSSPNAASNVPEFTVTTNNWFIMSSGYLIQQPNEFGVQIVTDTRSNPVGIYDASTGTIIDNQNNIILTDVKLDELLIVTPNRTIIGIDGTEINIDDKTVIKGPTPVSQAAQPASSSLAPVAESSSNVAPASTASSSSADTAAVSSSSAKSSSSSAKSSSSSAKSSSSSEEKSSSSKTPEAEPIKYVQGGHTGSGWATRYWDCCMPHCAWNENSGGNPTKTCDAKGKNFVQGGQNICAGGQNTTCTSQIPIIVNDQIAYAFAAVPAADGGKCGKCFALEFTGEGKYETKSNHQALRGKTLIVMASNIGGDVQGGQFDVMIPGGGKGAFDGCSQMGWGSQGEQYGGLLSDCEKEVNYADGNARKECLTRKCNEVFKNDEQAKEGCMFLATWMEAAGNPNHNFKEVECPQALKAKW